MKCADGMVKILQQTELTSVLQNFSMNVVPLKRSSRTPGLVFLTDMEQQDADGR